MEIARTWKPWLPSLTEVFYSYKRPERRRPSPDNSDEDFVYDLTLKAAYPDHAKEFTKSVKAWCDRIARKEPDGNEEYGSFVEVWMKRKGQIQVLYASESEIAAVLNLRDSNGDMLVVPVGKAENHMERFPRRPARRIDLIVRTEMNIW